MNLDGKVCLITGGTRGIGAATALALAARGADIGVVSLNAPSGRPDVEERVRSMGRRFYYLSGDVANPESCERFVSCTAQVLGSVDVLVHCAGGLVTGGLLELTPEDWRRAFDVHVHAAFHLCRAAVPGMKARGEGSIVLISSVAGMRGCKGILAYGVVKGSIPQFARALARELADDNIRVNAVAPGVIRTRFQDILTPEQVENNIRNRIPLHREGTPQDVAEAIAMLVTNEFITGETLAVDGGMTMRIV